MDSIDMDITDTDRELNALQLYENVSAIKPSSKNRTLQLEEEHYDALKFEGGQEVKVKTNHESNASSGPKQKIMICSILVSILVLYIAIIALVIFLFVPRNPVDGQWSDWSSWTSCDVTCGNGTVLRTRQCATVPTNKGTDCVGESLQSTICFKSNCPGKTYNPFPVDGQWTYWSSWTSCDVSCGKGSHLRTRRCTNPVPINSGKDCIGESLQSSSCLKTKCPAIMSTFSVTEPHIYSSIDGISRLTFSSTIYQYGSDFNISTGTFTCSLPGVYHFSVTLVKKRSSTRVDRVYCDIFKNIQSLIKVSIDPTDDETDKGNAAVSQAIVIDLDIGDAVYLGNCIDPAKNMEHWSSFTGFLLYLKS